MKYASIAVVGLGLTLFACSPSGQDHSGSETAMVDSTAGSIEDSSVFMESSTVLPSPLQIANIYQKAGVKYNESLMNPLNNAAKYNSQQAKNINLGVYSADLAYCILNDQTQKGLLYLKAVKQLSDEAGLSELLETQAIIQRFEKNIGNKDSLTQIFSDFNSESDFYFEENDKQSQALMIFTGAWIESYYIASSLAQKENSEAIVSRLVEQKLTLDKLVAMLKTIAKSETNFEPMANDLAGIKALIDGLEGIKSFQGDPEDIDLLQVKMSKEELKALGEAVSAVRKKFISNN